MKEETQETDFRRHGKEIYLHVFSWPALAFPTDVHCHVLVELKLSSAIRATR